MDVAAPIEEGVTSVTPSGLEIYYQSEPKRLYRVRHSEWRERNLSKDWVEVPSVTTVLDVLHKDALTWWGQGIGIDAVQELVRRELVQIALDGEHKPRLIAIMAGGPRWATRDDIIALMKLNFLTTNQVRDTAAARGTDVHDALEAWANTGIPPKPEDFDAEKHGYVRGLQAFLVDLGDAVEPVAQEIMVGSLEHRFAGRYDLRIRLTSPRRVICKITDSRQERYMKHATIPEGEGIIDLKTSKYIYDTHYLQLEGYEGASVECGYEPSDWRAVLHVTPDGFYECARSRASYEDFLSVRETYDVVARTAKAHNAKARGGQA